MYRSLAFLVFVVFQSGVALGGICEVVGDDGRFQVKVDGKLIHPESASYAFTSALERVQGNARMSGCAIKVLGKTEGHTCEVTTPGWFRLKINGKDIYPSTAHYGLEMTIEDAVIFERNLGCSVTILGRSKANTTCAPKGEGGSYRPYINGVSAFSDIYTSYEGALDYCAAVKKFTRTAVRKAQPVAPPASPSLPKPLSVSPPAPPGDDGTP